MSKLIQIIDFTEKMASKVPDHLNLEIEALIEDFDIEGYIVGSWGHTCLPYKDTIELKFLLVEFLTIYNSLPRSDHYTLTNRDSLIQNKNFIRWQTKCSKIISDIKLNINECDEKPVDFISTNSDFSILNLSRKSKSKKI